MPGLNLHLRKKSSEVYDLDHAIRDQMVSPALCPED